MMNSVCFVLIVVLVSELVCLSTGQWAQTMGWGGAGAGTGKRAALGHSSCSDNTATIQRLISLLAEVSQLRTKTRTEFINILLNPPEMQVADEFLTRG